MIIAVRTSLAFCAMALALVVPQERGWHGIRPLHATRADVEKLVGAPMDPNGAVYDTKDERVTIVYSSLPCAKGWPYGYNVPPTTVLSIVTYPKATLTVSDLGIDLTKYKTTYRPENRRVIYYSDDDSITLETESNRRIVSIQYLPASADDHVRCPDFAARETSIEKGESIYTKPELYYFDTSEKEQRVRLDYFGDRLQQRASDSIVYIIGYAGKLACPNEALHRAKWAKDYLAKRRKIPDGRIKVIDGGYRDDIWVELFIAQPRDPKPLASPNIYPRSARTRSDCGRRHHKPKDQ